MELVINRILHILLTGGLQSFGGYILYGVIYTSFLFLVELATRKRQEPGRKDLPSTEDLYIAFVTWPLTALLWPFFVYNRFFPFRLSKENRALKNRLDMFFP